MGLKKHHKVLEVGVGPMRFARLLIPFLEPNNYCGVEPNKNFVQAGQKKELFPLFGSISRYQKPRIVHNAVMDFSEFNDEFDYIICYGNPLEIETLNLFYQNASQKLKDSGKILYAWYDSPIQRAEIEHLSKILDLDTIEFERPKAWLKKEEWSWYVSTKASRLVVGSTENINYRLYKQTKDYDKLVVWLHGAGERGDDNLSSVSGWSIYVVQKLLSLGCDVLVPQCPKESKWVDIDWSMDDHEDLGQTNAMSDVVKLVGQFKRGKNYVVGQSMGGFGVWDCMARHPKLFDAGIAFCGGICRGLSRKITNPIWAFRSSNDPTVPMKNSVKAVNNCEYAKLTKMSIGHRIAEAALADPDTLDWLFRH